MCPFSSVWSDSVNISGHISYRILSWGGGGMEEVEEWEDERRDAAPLRML